MQSQARLALAQHPSTQTQGKGKKHRPMKAPPRNKASAPRKAKAPSGDRTIMRVMESLSVHEAD